jgi:Zn-dependent protease/predicted transcriptional regulator
MNCSLNLGKYFGIKVSIHWTFLLLIGWIVWRESRRGSSTEEIIWVVLFVLTIFLCVTLHEFGHALTARRYKINTLDITLLPIGGLARLESMPEKPAQELAVAIAGPMVNIVIAMMLFPFIINKLNVDYISTLEGIGKQTFLLNLFSVNIMLALFNMLPAFPMDGGRVFRALLSFRLQRHVATKIAAAAGQTLAVGFIISGFFFNPFLIFIGLFIFLGAQAETNLTTNKFMLAGYKVADVSMSNFGVIEADDALSKAVSLLLDGQSKNFIVMQNNTVVGTLSRDELIKGLTMHGKEVTVSTCMNSKVVLLNAETPLEEAYQLMQQQSQVLLPVMKNDMLVGALDLENILEFIMVKHAVKK